MGTNNLQDTLRWVVIGGTVETARRVSKSAWNGFIDSKMTIHMTAWGQSREFDITTRSVGRTSITQSTTGDLEEEEIDDDEDELVHGRRKRKVAFMPSPGTTHTIYYRGHWLRITRTQKSHGYHCYSEIAISVIARNNSILKKLVLEAKREYEKDAEHRVHIFMADSYGSWRWNGARQKRPMSSIVLDPSVKEMLLADCRDFLRSEEWYAERGIPFRRGYLLYGVPGSGKTSLIHSLAGELGLDIYVLSLSSKGMSDNTLATLMGGVPSRCILLLEDLDAAFTRSVSRDEQSTGSPKDDSSSESSSSKSSSSSSEGSTLSLSGLLNALDGVAAAEGRLLFATTNHIDRLDPALSRPGRMDVWVNFTNATKWQAEGIFKCFFPTRSAKEKAESSTSSPASEKDKDAGTRNVPGMKRKTSVHTVPVLEEEEINELAKRFAEQIPEDEMSVASLQGYLLKNKTRPRECVDEVADWIIKEREARAKLKREKEEKEAKEALEASEKVVKEKAVKEKTSKERAEKDEKSSKRDSQKTSRSERRSLEKLAAGSESTHITTPPPSSSTSGSSSTTCSSDSSSSVSDYDGSGVDADTEDSMTTDEEIEKFVDAATTSEAATEQKAKKWVNVKGNSEKVVTTTTSTNADDANATEETNEATSSA
ncbi:hypothetical protein A7U60_g5203 [Sanghuangporus baumii]|uniref:P-loop containing nucleoside triphosphate hydrolase protein n=1 Tax=Sanghuangporus baumii TaxID=108892 RepID=A0A9Q5N3Y5_SANBA|nr:hypothetical protein A7U60_g5203 [Sanghuangporus baumii]